MRAKQSFPVFTIGHSTHSAEELILTLQAYEVRTLVDVRTVPRSRTNPQFNRDVFPALLKSAGLRYVHLASLGGLRRPRKDSPNGAWRNTSFRGYADHLASPEFERGLAKVLALREKGAVALMCAEAVWWRCHRSIIADVLVARKIPVFHIMSLGAAPEHRLREWARASHGKVTYPAPS